MSWRPKSPMQRREGELRSTTKRGVEMVIDWQWSKDQRMAKPKKGVAIMIWNNSSVAATNNKWHDGQMNNLA